MTEEEMQHEQEYFQQMEYERQVQEAAHFLMNNGFIVIPLSELPKFMGRYEIVPVTKSNDVVNDSEIPF